MPSVDAFCANASTPPASITAAVIVDAAVFWSCVIVVDWSVVSSVCAALPKVLVIPVASLPYFTFDAIFAISALSTSPFDHFAIAAAALALRTLVS